METSTYKLYYFINPIQVQYINFENDKWMQGIGYKDEIIDYKTGKVIKITDICSAENLIIEPNPIVTFETWTGLD